MSKVESEHLKNNKLDWHDFLVVDKIPEGEWSLSVNEEKHAAYLRNGAGNVMRKIKYFDMIEKATTEDIWRRIFKQAYEIVENPIYVSIADAFRDLSKLTAKEAMEVAYRRKKKRERYTKKDRRRERIFTKEYLNESEV